MHEKMRKVGVCQKSYFTDTRKAMMPRCASSYQEGGNGKPKRALKKTINVSFPLPRLPPQLGFNEEKISSRTYCVTTTTEEKMSL